MHTLSFRSKHRYDSLQSGIEVSVELRHGAAAKRLMAKVDTGASFCIFQREFAEALDIDVESGQQQRVATANGWFLTYGHEIELVCLDLRTALTAYFSAEANFPRNVLGRAGWLNRYRLGIVEHDLSIYLSQYDDLPQ